MFDKKLLAAADQGNALMDDEGGWFDRIASRFLARRAPWLDAEKSGPGLGKKLAAAAAMWHMNATAESKHHSEQAMLTAVLEVLVTARALKTQVEALGANAQAMVTYQAVPTTKGTIFTESESWRWIETLAAMEPSIRTKVRKLGPAKRGAPRTPDSDVGFLTMVAEYLVPYFEGHSPKEYQAAVLELSREVYRSLKKDAPKKKFGPEWARLKNTPRFQIS